MSTITFTRSQFNEYAELYNQAINKGETSFVHKGSLHSIYDNFIMEKFASSFEKSHFDTIIVGDNRRR